MSEILAGCCAEAAVQTCWPVVERHYRLICCVLTAVAVPTAIVIGLAVAFGVARPIVATVEAASLSRLALANANDTYDLSLTVALRNPNVALRALHTAPLDAGLSVAGRRFGSTAFRLADAGQALHAKETVEYLVEAAGTVLADDLPLPFGSVLPVELALAGEVTYRPLHRDKHALVVICTLQLQLPPPPGTTQVAPVFHPIKRVRAAVHN